MFKLAFDKDYLGNYTDHLKQLKVDFTKVSTFAYNHLRIYSRPIVSSIFGGRFIPIKILVSIRTDRTNELIVPDNGKFYTDCTAEYPSEHPLDDTVLLAAKSFIDEHFDCGEEIVKVIPRTIPLPVGACYFNDTFYVYVNVVVDHTLKNESFFNLKDCHYENISDITVANALECALKDSLAIVYNMNTDEVSDNVNDDH